MAKKSREKLHLILLPSDQIKKLPDLATFDGVAIAQEIADSLERLLKERPMDHVFLDRARESLEKCCNTLSQLEKGKEVLDVLIPLLKKVRSFQKR